jgi:uncharacterized protein (DUF58 family)
MNNKQYLDPAILSSISNLELIARLVVEGFLTGLHKSPFHGFSVEFSQHRPYIPGDNLRYLDWKVFARTDRYYIKQFEEETNLRNYIVLDTSRSMLFGSKKITKHMYASYLAAALAYLLVHQRDATGLVLFDEKIRKILRPRAVTSYISPLIAAIDNIEHGEDTNISIVLHEMAEQINRRGLIILISDLLDEPEQIISGLKHFRYNEHEVLVFHIIDKNEHFFNFEGDIIFEDMESGEKIKTQPWFIKDFYKSKYQDYLDFLKEQCSANRIDYQRIYTDMPFNMALSEYLLKRKRFS